MSLVGAIGRFTGIIQEEAPAPIGDRSGTRRALLARAQRGRMGAVGVREPVRTRTDEAGDFASFAARGWGVDIAGDGPDVVATLDRMLDDARDAGGGTIVGVRIRQAAAWIGEIARRRHDLSWTDDWLVTDGRLAFDPGRAVSARLSSPDAPTVSEELEAFSARLAIEDISVAA